MTRSECIFCRIIAGEIPAKLVHEDDRTIAFHDVSPQAPVHVLVVPRRHVANVLEAQAETPETAGHLVAVATALARQLGVADSGFRLVLNQGDDGGQSVHHLHLHLLGGRELGWPPG
jgi:histidine triad (HIT) family protein